MHPTNNVSDFIPLDASESQNSDLFVPMDQDRPRSNGYENKENESELSEDIRKLIQSVTQASSAGGWNSGEQSSFFQSRPVANGGSVQTQDHNMQDAPATENHIEAKSEHQANPLRDTSATLLDERAASEPSPVPPALTMQPHFIIFGASEEDLSYMIPKKGIQNIPEMVLRKLAMRSTVEGPVMSMQNYHQLESMKRLKEFLDDKKYRPFKPQIPLDQVLADGSTRPWDPSARSISALKAVKVTDATRDLFVREIELYQFAKELDFDELRQASLKNIMHGYPKSIDSVWMLVEDLFIKSHRSDRVLRQHIVDLINANREELAAHKSYPQFMRRFLTIDGAFGEALLDAYIKAAEDTRRKVIELSAKEPFMRVRSEKPVPKEPAAATPRKISISTGATFPLKCDAGWPAHELRPSDLPKVSEAFLQGRVVIARKSGYGTLVRPGVGRDRNRDFQFSGGEMLLVNPLASTSSAHNIVVYNSQGEKGDVLADLICAFPAELGVHPRDRGKFEGLFNLVHH
jgi:hypothetical protein